MHRTLVTRRWLVRFRSHRVRAGIASAQDAAQVEKGAEVYAAQKCSMCHSIAGKGGKASPLDGVGKKLSADEIRDWIVTRSRPRPSQVHEEAADADEYGKLPAADIDALVAYMASLKK